MKPKLYKVTITETAWVAMSDSYSISEVRDIAYERAVESRKSHPTFIQESFAVKIDDLAEDVVKLCEVPKGTQVHNGIATTPAGEKIDLGWAKY